MDIKMLVMKLGDCGGNLWSRAFVGLLGNEMYQKAIPSRQLTVLDKNYLKYQEQALVQTN
jgi:hypothetical protein